MLYEVCNHEAFADICNGEAVKKKAGSHLHPYRLILAVIRREAGVTPGAGCQSFGHNHYIHSYGQFWTHQLT